jgi:hypothetical protein
MFYGCRILSQRCLCRLQASQRAYSTSLAEFALLSPDEVGLFSKWLEVMMGEGNGSINQIFALNKVAELPNRMARKVAQTVVDRLARSNWIVVVSLFL